tara:strand:- start:3458 stop:3733 length:276 start_codon:yes stop_codon:yes gene_type:complete
MRPEYEKILDQMYFEIGTTLVDNDGCRKGIFSDKPMPETEILKSNRRTFMNLKVMMMRLERSLFGAQDGEKPVQEISNRNISKSSNVDNVD